MATQIVMSKVPAWSDKRTQLVDMLGPAAPETDSGLAFSFKKGDYLCTVEYQGKIQVPAAKALDWLGLKAGEVHTEIRLEKVQKATESI